MTKRQNRHILMLIERVRYSITHKKITRYIFLNGIEPVLYTLSICIKFLLIESAKGWQEIFMYKGWGKMKFNTGQYNALEVFLKAEEGKKGRAVIYDGRGNVVKELEAGQYQYRLFKTDLQPETEYRMELENAAAAMGYLSECSDILERGVRFIEFADEKTYDKGNLAEVYDTPIREQYHFGPYCNWINDPNGLCYYKGYYHMYYQANPFGQEWGHMYWGHAASKNLVHWVHLPYARVPQEEILNAPDKKGGAFSGCAVPLEEEIVFYLTRHFGPPEDSEEETVQYQTMVTSEDSIHFGGERIIIEKPDKGFSYNFRDPKVICENGKWQMVLGTIVDGIPSVVLYTSSDMEKWEYEGVLLEECQKGVYTIECPDLFFLDQKWVVTADLMYYTDPQGRKQPGRYYIGEKKGSEFIVEHAGLYDFGSDFYAVQSFEHEGRRIAIGWISDQHEDHVKEPKGAYGSMSLPRELSVKNGKLYQLPVKEAEMLKGKTIYQGSQENQKLSVEGNTYYAHIRLSGETDFNIVLAEEEETGLYLICEKGTARFQSKGMNTDHVKYTADTQPVREIEIYMDRRVCEVFINGGEAAGAKLCYLKSKKGCFEIKAENPEMIEHTVVREMKAVW